MTRRIVNGLPTPEKSLISQIRRLARTGGGVVAGIGDDCAILSVPSGHQLLVTTDFTLENVHFRRDWHSPEVVGRRCLSRGLSDIAAMGGEPRAAFLSLALDRNTPQRWVDGFLKGLLRTAAEFEVSLAGGDTAQSDGGIQADIVLIGSVPIGKAILRSGARPGDLIYVTGELGGAAAALVQLRRGKINPSDYTRHFHSQARISAGLSLRRRGLASAMIDTSDGLSTDLQHICEESGVGAEIDEAAIPRARIGLRREPVSLELALHGGEDYELLFTSRKKVPGRIAGIPLTAIGRVTRKRGMRLHRNGHAHPFAARGWEHFSQHS